MNGYPSDRNQYLFNGDFVDRGAHGFECITLMFAMMAAYPDYVFLNRGNHEDPNVCCNYGFQREIYEKYDQLTFMLFAEIFKYVLRPHLYVRGCIHIAYISTHMCMHIIHLYNASAL